MKPPADQERFDGAIAAIDAVNAEDPNVLEVDGVVGRKELMHARMMTAWLDRLDPEADEIQHIAARAHHLRRWASPRDAYPSGRAGYLQWRTAAKQRHAAEVSALLLDVGYSDAEAESVAVIVRKDGVARGRVPLERAARVHEDALCLVFLQTQLVSVADQLGDDATVDVLAKTLPKMSADGLAAAGSLHLGARGRDLLAAAVDRVGGGPAI